MVAPSCELPRLNSLQVFWILLSRSHPTSREADGTVVSTFKKCILPPSLLFVLGEECGDGQGRRGAGGGETEGVEGLFHIQTLRCGRAFCLERGSLEALKPHLLLEVLRLFSHGMSIPEGNEWSQGDKMQDVGRTLSSKGRGVLFAAS